MAGFLLQLSGFADSLKIATWQKKPQFEQIKASYFSNNKNSHKVKHDLYEKALIF